MDNFERIKRISSSIQKQAELEKSELIYKANQMHDTQMKAAEEKIVETVAEDLQKKSTKIRQECTSAVASERIAARETLIRRRSEKTQLTFIEVKARLMEYAKTEEYKTKMLNEISAIKNSYDHSCSTLFFKEDDLALQEEILKILPNAVIKSDRKITIGGFKLLNTASAILIDCTLDTRLRDQKIWFLQNCGMQVS